MALQMRWVGTEELDRVAETRWMCYSHAQKELERYQLYIREDPRAAAGDFLLAERDGMAVGTATSLSMTLWARGAALSCQGVAYVGTIKSARRGGGTERGIASAVMTETVRRAREQGHVVSALMPFRVSFYEHFGYGLVERRCEWTIPLATIPHQECGGWRFSSAADRPAIAAQWQKAVEAGQCDIERSDLRWKHRLFNEVEGIMFVERPDASGPVLASAFVTQESANGRSILKIQEWSAGSTESFTRLLAFFGSMRDQFSFVAITTPVDLPVNRLLREPQIPHRPVDHPAPEVRTYTRMQLRILDHRKYLESIRWPAGVRGRVSVGVAECEWNVSRFSVEVESGSAKVRGVSGDVDFECGDRHWAAIATGDLSASAAVRWGLARENRAGAAGLLDALAGGAVPFCREYF